MDTIPQPPVVEEWVTVTTKLRKSVNRAVEIAAIDQNTTKQQIIDDAVSAFLHMSSNGA